MVCAVTQWILKLLLCGFVPMSWNHLQTNGCMMSHMFMFCFDASTAEAWLSYQLFCGEEPPINFCHLRIETSKKKANGSQKNSTETNFYWICMFLPQYINLLFTSKYFTSSTCIIHTNAFVIKLFPNNINWIILLSLFIVCDKNTIRGLWFLTNMKNLWTFFLVYLRTTIAQTTTFNKDLNIPIY